MQRRISINTDGSLAINQVGPDNIGIYKCVVQTTQGEMEDAAAWLRIIGNIFWKIFFSILFRKTFNASKCSR